ncbi:MAG: branched-chain amino acid ABC transporter permease [Thermodesulfobacteriota bacterium]
MDPTTAMYVSQGIHGLAYGMVLFLVASGVSLIIGMMHIFNMAHAGFFMLSAYFTYQAIAWTGNFWLALLLAPIATGICGMLMERFLLRPLRGAGVIGDLILTVGVGLCIDALVKIIWGTANKPLDIPPVLQGMVNIVGLDYPSYRLFIIGMALLVLLIMALLLYKTRIGKIVRAAVSDNDMVNALGINIPLLFTFVFGVGIWLAGVAGAAIAPILSVFPGLALQMGMDAFIVVAVAGFGSLKGAFLVSILFGLMNSYGVQFISQLAPLSMFIFMAIAMIFFPHGFFGESEEE